MRDRVVVSTRAGRPRGPCKCPCASSPRPTLRRRTAPGKREQIGVMRAAQGDPDGRSVASEEGSSGTDDRSEASELRPVEGEGAGDGPPFSSYKPSKSGSWGLFERPANISKAYGGGKNIPFGGQALDSDEIEEKRKKTLAKIQQYRKKKLELDNADLDDDTLRKAKLGIERGKILMRKGNLSSAKEEFLMASELVSQQSTLGGEAALQIAICLDSTGNYEEAKSLYKKLKTHRDYTISKQAENFLFGFEAMDELKAEKYKYDPTQYKRYFDGISRGDYLPSRGGEEEGAEMTAADKIIIASVFLVPAILFLTFVL